MRDIKHVTLDGVPVRIAHIASYPKYFVTETGHVYTIGTERKRGDNYWQNEWRKIDNGAALDGLHQMAECVQGKGYLFVTLCNNSGVRHIMVHRLVANAFLADVAGRTVDHIDCDRQNNSLTNLQIVSNAENSSLKYQRSTTENTRELTLYAPKSFSRSLRVEIITPDGEVHNECVGMVLECTTLLIAASGNIYRSYDAKKQFDYFQCVYQKAAPVILAEKASINFSYNGYGYISAIYQETAFEKRRVNLRVHRLVAAVFLGSVDQLVVNHKNFKRADNRVENLEIVTQKENMVYSVQRDRCPRMLGKAI